MQGKGKHGTSVTRAKKIVADQKFLPSPDGRVGSGIYFWRDNALADDLARCWHQDQVGKGAFAGEEEPYLAIISATLECAESECLDLEDPIFKDKLAEIVAGRKKKGERLTQADQTKLITVLVKAIDNQTGTAAKILIVRLAPPQSYISYEIALLGAPLCYVARSSDCIKIDKVIAIGAQGHEYEIQ